MVEVLFFLIQLFSCERTIILDFEPYGSLQYNTVQAS